MIVDQPTNLRHYDDISTGCAHWAHNDTPFILTGPVPELQGATWSTKVHPAQILRKLSNPRG